MPAATLMHQIVHILFILYKRCVHITPSKGWNVLLVAVHFDITMPYALKRGMPDFGFIMT